MTLTGPQGSAVLHLTGARRLQTGADATQYLHLVTPAAANVDLSVYASFVGAGRAERDEVLTTAPLFTVTPTETSGPGAGVDGLLTLFVDGSQIGQDTIGRGHYDVYGVTAAGAHVLLVTGRYICVGSAVDPDAPAAP